MLLKPTTLLVNEYAHLGAPYVRQVAVTPLTQPAHLLAWNTDLALQLGLNGEAPNGSSLKVLAGQADWPGYTSVASVYCGHQFGHFVPQLGDGRALLVAELRNGPAYFQLQLKGAGPTPYSRFADGRAVLRSSIREYVASEAMHALGVPTTRALSLAGTADPVFRETTETAAVVCRVAPSFLRFGHVEYFSHTGQTDALLQLLGWHIEHQHPDLMPEREDTPSPETLLRWFKWVSTHTAQLVAQWQGLGFCHGVMNTDNMSLLGLTLDYGPYGFIDNFNIDHICNHSDEGGRYSYRNQPQIAHWNLYALAQGLMPLLAEQRDSLQAVLDDFPAQFESAHQAVFCNKLGIDPTLSTQANALIESTFKLLHEHRLDFTRFFRSLSALCVSNKPSSLQQAFAQWQQAPTFALALGDEAQVNHAQAWLAQWLACKNPLATAQTLDAINPCVVPRNHLLQQAIESAQQGLFDELNALIEACTHPFEHRPEWDHFTHAAPAWAHTLSVSCSS